MAPEAVSGSSTPACTSTSMVQTPRVWEVSHACIDQAHAQAQTTASPASAFELFTDVPFIWSYPAKSAFVTGTFSNWETTDPMTQISGIDGPFWAFTKALPPGEYQYKFIIDNVWRHAPDQHITRDERGIINNVLSVAVEACGDVTCFCSSFFANARTNTQDTAAVTTQIRDGIMTPQTMAKFQRNIGVAYRYVERSPRRNFPFRKTFMHREISDRPFDVTVVNVKNLMADKLLFEDHPTEGTISRVSSYEYINLEKNARYDPNVPVVEDAAYAAVLNDQASSFPHTAPNRAYASGDPTEFAYSVRARLSSPLLGFNEKECHPGIKLLYRNHCAIRMHDRWLYKSVRGVLPVRKDKKRVYFEFFVLRQTDSGGVCLGLATPELPLNCLCGTRPNSIGFCTSGSLIRTVDGKETWTAFGNDVGSRSTVGCLVGLEKVIESRKTVLKADVQFFVDGCSRGTVDYEFIGDLDVYPTLSLYAKNTSVYSLFGGADMLFTSCLPRDEDVLDLNGEKIGRDPGNTPRSLGLSTSPEEEASNMQHPAGS